jgi:hypothetical protein
MKKFTKTLLAAALVAGAGAANASIAYDKGGLNEAYMSAYDSTTGKTFTFDTGVTYNTLLANVSNAAYSLNFDLSGSNWTNFITGASTSAIKYVIGVGNAIDFGAMLTGAPLLPNTGTVFGFDTASTISNHAIDINSKTGVNIAENLSTIVLDTETPGVGQHANAASAWGGWNQDPQIAYGQVAGFQLGQLNLNDGSNIATTFAGKWKLDGNNLSFAAAPVSQVPLPAAVWLFGSALMGFFGINRRKSIAA